MQPELPDDELDDDDDELDDDEEELEDDDEELEDEAPDEDVTVEDDDVEPPAPPPPSDEEGLGSRSELLPPQPAHRESPAQRVTAAAVRARIPSFYTISHRGDGARINPDVVTEIDLSRGSLTPCWNAARASPIDGLNAETSS